MITAPQPWSTWTDGAFTFLRDATGKQFAKFTDWQDAENILQLLAGHAEKLEELQDEIEGYEEELDKKTMKWEEENREHEEELQALKEELQICKDNQAL